MVVKAMKYGTYTALGFSHAPQKNIFVWQYCASKMMKPYTNRIPNVKENIAIGTELTIT